MRLPAPANFPKQILRVFPEKTTGKRGGTSQTPTDEFAWVGSPDLFSAQRVGGLVSAVHVSCVFTWQRPCGKWLAEEWRARIPDVPVLLGGPAFDDPGGPFWRGFYVKDGVTINSRGCPGACPWCFVPKREGKLRLLPITPGHIVQDNNVLAFPRDHFARLCRMLEACPSPARFIGGLEAARLKGWHVDQLRKLRIGDVWFAADTDAALPTVTKAASMLGLPRRKTRCYVLVGFQGEGMAAAEKRLEAVWSAGCLPFAQLYRDESGGPTYSKEWKRFVRTWSRPAAMFAEHKGDA